MSLSYLSQPLRSFVRSDIQTVGNALCRVRVSLPSESTFFINFAVQYRVVYNMAKAGESSLPYHARKEERSDGCARLPSSSSLALLCSAAFCDATVLIRAGHGGERAQLTVNDPTPPIHRRGRGRHVQDTSLSKSGDWPAGGPGTVGHRHRLRNATKVHRRRRGLHRRGRKGGRALLERV